MNNSAIRPKASKQNMNKFKTKIRKGLFNNKSSVEATSSDAVFMLSVLLIMRNQALDHYLGKTLHK